MVSKNLKFIILLLLIVSCRDKKEEINLQNIIKKEVDSINKDTVRIVQKDTMAVAESDDLFTILLPTSYRISGNGDPTQILNNNWFDLFEKDNKYYLEKANYTIIKGFDECAGVDTKTIETRKKTLLLVDDSKLSIGEVTFLPIVKKHIWPKQQQLFSFNNQTYTLRAEGITEDNLKPTSNTDDETLWGKVKNYKLYLTVTGIPETLVFSQDSFSDTFVELLFVGDIDRDGKLDFIFGANRNYEETRVILFLSSEAEKNKIIRKVSEIVITSDC